MLIRKFLATSFLAGLFFSPTIQADELLRLVSSAKDFNPTYQRAVIALDRQKQLYKQAYAALYPSVNLVGNAGISDSDDQDTSTEYSAGITLRQPLFSAGVNEQKKLEQLNVEAARIGLESTAQSVSIEVLRAYFNVLSANDSLQLQIALREATAKRLDDAKQRYDVGLIAITDVHEAQARYDSINAAKIAAQNFLDNSLETLYQLTGVDSVDMKQLNTGKNYTLPIPKDVKDWLALAEKENLSIRSGLNSIAIAQRGEKVAKSFRLPTVFLDGSSRYVDRDSVTGSGRNDSIVNQASISLQVPIYTGGENAARINAASLAVSDSMQAVRNARLSVRTEIRNAWRGLDTGLQQIKARKQALVSQISALEATEAGFKAGTRTVVDVLNQQSERHRAVEALKSAKYDFLISLMELNLNAGTDLKETITELESYFN